MHTCVRCGREATSLEEINLGCPCGSKVFVFGQKAMDNLRSEDPLSVSDKPPSSVPDYSTLQEPLPQNAVAIEQSQQPLSMAREENNAAPQAEAAKAAGGANDEGSAPQEANENGTDGRAPESYFARTTFSTEDVENIKIVSEGIFFVDVNALSKNPVVLKDEEGVYYVRLPMPGKENGEAKKGNGQKG